MHRRKETEMRASRILLTGWISCLFCLAAYDAGWLWSYQTNSVDMVDVENLCWRLWM